MTNQFEIFGSTLCITPTVKHGEDSVIVGGDFASWGFALGEVQIELAYCSIPSGMWIKFTSKLCQIYIKSKEEQHNLQLMSSPVQSHWTVMGWS